MWRVKLSSALALVVVALIVILQNTNPVAVRFLFGEVTLPVAALLGIVLLLGFALGILFSLLLPAKHRAK